MQITSCLFLLFLAISSIAQKPVLVKLPFAFSDIGRTPMENTPVLMNSRLLLVSNNRPGGADAKGKDAYLYIDDLQTGKEVARFGQGHSFVSAYLNGNELNVFALEFTDFGRIMNSTGINRLTSTDLKTWKTEKVILPEGKEHLFNSSVCRNEKGYLMAYESDKPVQFCFKFARSNDLSKWEKLPELVFTGVNHEYSACPLIRYIKPYYYVIYLHAPLTGHNGWISYLTRSKDLENWELSPYNPILEAETGEGRNNSDVDIIEYQGKTYLYYATGDQETWGTVRVAQYDGAEKAFFEGHFPKNTAFAKTSAKIK
jgi:beta-xylosidase